MLMCGFFNFFSPSLGMTEKENLLRSKNFAKTAQDYTKVKLLWEQDLYISCLDI